MFQARALLVTAVLTVTVPHPLAAMDVPPCEQIRQHAKKYTLQQIKDMAKRAGLSEEEFAALMRCIGPKK